MLQTMSKRKSVPVTAAEVEAIEVRAPEPPIEKPFVRQIAESPAMWQAFNETHFEPFDSLTLEARMRRVVLLAPGEVRADDESFCVPPRLDYGSRGVAGIA